MEAEDWMEHGPNVSMDQIDSWRTSQHKGKDGQGMDRAWTRQMEHGLERWLTDLPDGA